MIGTGVVHNKLEPVAVWEERLELAFPGFVAGIHAGVVPGLLLLFRLRGNCIEQPKTTHPYINQSTYQQIKLSEANTQAVGAAVAQP